MKKNLLFFITLYTELFVVSSPIAETSGGSGKPSNTAYAVLCGGTTSVSAWQSIASLGTSGNPLVSNGPASLPTFQTLPFAGGGTGATSLSSGVISSNGSVLSSLGIGSANQVLKNSSGTVNWALTGVLQMVATSISTLVGPVTSIPDDDTIPQFSEGTLVLSQSITPKSASSNLFIIFSTGGTPSASGAAIAALFVNSGANALSAAYIGERGPGSSYAGMIQYITTAGSTSARTYQARVGGGGFRINGSSASQKFDGVASTYLVIIEYI